ncbi:MAG: hypothetical protein WD379_10295 [Dehalococcoidia bacterium]
MRPALTWACVASLVVLALILGLATGVDRNGNLDTYTSNLVVLLTFCALDITALIALGILNRPSTAAVASSLLAMMTILVYWLAVIANHPGEFTPDSPVADVVLTTLGIATLVSMAALLGGLVGFGASVVLLGSRRLRNDVWSRLGPHD